MSRRWRILALLFAVRTTMALQFQSVAALAPLVQREFGVDVADIGLSIGLYLAPGIALALPGGAIGKRHGDKAVVVVGLVLMLCGALLMVVSGSWNLQLAARLMAGVGGVLLNVLMSKMVTDWFAGREIATAMAIFVNSWPFGIALALIILPPLGTRFGLSAAFLLTAVLIGLGLLAMALYQAPQEQAGAGAAGARPFGSALVAIVLAGLAWGLFNAAVAMIFGFGPTLLAERGWSLAAGSSMTSIVLWLAIVSVPLGGFLADRSGRHDAVLFGSCLGSCALLPLAARTDAVLPVFIVLGLVSGLAAGPIMGLPARVLPSATRAVGMGIFYTVFYALAVLAPWLGGLLAHAAGSLRVTFDLGAAMLALCCVCAWAFNKAAARAACGRAPASR